MASQPSNSAASRLLERKVCAEEKPPFDYPLGLCAAHCSWKTSMCTSCLHFWMRTSLEENQWRKANCPECSGLMTPADINRLSDAATSTRYNQMTVRRSRNADPNFYWCSNPSYDDGSVYYLRDVPMQCRSCGHVTCVRHHHPIPWHYGQTCEEYESDPKRAKQNERVNAERIANDKLLHKISKKCPKCRTDLQRNKGCDHMTCYCGFEFCWRCLREQIGPHERSCKNYEGNMEEELLAQRLHDTHTAPRRRPLPGDRWRERNGPEHFARLAQVAAEDEALRQQLESQRQSLTSINDLINRRPPQLGSREWYQQRLQQLPGHDTRAQIGAEDARYLERQNRPRHHSHQAPVEIDVTTYRGRQGLSTPTPQDPPTHPHDLHSPFSSTNNPAPSFLVPSIWQSQTSSTGLSFTQQPDIRNVPHNTGIPRDSIWSGHPRPITPGQRVRRNATAGLAGEPMTIAQIEASYTDPSAHDPEDGLFNTSPHDGSRRRRGGGQGGEGAWV